MAAKIIPEDFLQVTERGAGKVHEIPLEKLKDGTFITLGSKPATDSHYQLGEGSEAQPWISSCHATLFAKPRNDASGDWDYYIKDGCKGQGEWKSSTNGVWVSGKRLEPDYELQIRPGHGGFVTVFPKIHDIIYEAVLEWPVKSDPRQEADNSNPTLQQYQRIVVEKDEALLGKRVAEEQAALNKTKLEKMAVQLVTIQRNHKQESKELYSKLNEQSDTLITLAQQLADEQSINRTQDGKLTKLRNFGAAAVIAFAISLGVEIEQWEKGLQIVAALSTGCAVWAATEKPKTDVSTPDFRA